MIRIWFRIRSGLVATLSRTLSLVPFVKSPVKSVVKFDSNEELYEFSRSIR